MRGDVPDGLVEGCSEVCNAGGFGICYCVCGDACGGCVILSLRMVPVCLAEPFYESLPAMHTGTILRGTGSDPHMYHSHLLLAGILSGNIVD